MRVINLDNTNNIADINLTSDNKLTISAFNQEVTIDLQEEQDKFNKKVINVMLKNGKLVINEGNEYYVAIVNIPPEEYEQNVIGTDDEGNPIVELNKIDNLDKTEVVLFDLGKVSFVEDNSQTINNN